MIFEHYNNKKSRHKENPGWGFYVTPVRLVGINLDIYLGQHIFAFWISPTKKYGKGRK